MTGIDNHVVGLGNMYEKTAPNQIGRPGYEGVLSADYPTFVEVLKKHDYRTYMAGKWHLGHEPTMIPHARGFDRSFSILNGGGSHFDKTKNPNSSKTAAISKPCRKATTRQRRLPTS